MLTRVSNIEAHRRWMNWQPLFDGDEEPSLDDLVRQITTDEPSEAMMAGTAFHAALERAGDGAHETFVAMGYRFELPDGDIALPAVRELRAFKAYGDLQVTGKVDCIDGQVVMDHKTTSRCDVERYLQGCQWRFYLDIFGADVFQWHIFEIKELEPKVYRVSMPQILRAYRYPELHQDCALLAGEYLAFAKAQNLPDARID
jgi:hypothetical protein